jgi:uncharacterized membrane protein YccF (DUF307 family)
MFLLFIVRLLLVAEWSAVHHMNEALMYALVYVCIPPAVAATQEMLLRV